MHFASLLLLALAMSTDAFAVAIGRGVAMGRPSLARALKTGLLFGLTETITPILGWLLGYAAVQYVNQWDHWIVFGLLLVLGLRMIKNGLASKTEEEDKKSGAPFWLLPLLAISTSLDSFAVGISLAFIEVNIVLAACLIGTATFLMVSMGIMLGRKLGELVGRRAEIIGGLVLVTIGVWTLYEHLVG